MNTKCLVLLASLLPAVSFAHDWDVVAHVIQVTPAGDTFKNPSFAIDQNAGSCAAGTLLQFPGDTSENRLTAEVARGQFTNALVAQSQSTSLLAHTELVQGSSAKTYTLSVTPGTLTVTVTDVQAFAPLASLNAVLNNASQVLGQLSSSGTITYQVPAGVTTLFVNVIARAQGALDLGLYSINAQLTTPDGVAKAVHAGLLASQESGNQVEVHGSNAGCTVSSVHLLSH